MNAITCPPICAVVSHTPAPQPLERHALVSTIPPPVLQAQRTLLSPIQLHRCAPIVAKTPEQEADLVRGQYVYLLAQLRMLEDRMPEHVRVTMKRCRPETTMEHEQHAPPPPISDEQAQADTKKRRIAVDALNALMRANERAKFADPAEQNLRDYADWVFNGGAISEDCIALLITIVQEIAAQRICAKNQFAYFLFRVLDSGVFGDLIRRYEPPAVDAILVEEAAGRPLVMISNMSLWFDVCTFALNK